MTINKDGSYSFVYDGTLAFALAVAAAKDGALKSADEKGFEKSAEELRRAPGFKNVEYRGRGRYKVLFEKSGKPGEPFYFLSQESKFFSVLSQKDSLSVTGIRLAPKDIAQLNSIGAKVDGSLSVSVASGVKVVKHNAHSEPYFFGLLGSYKWHINAPADFPEIVLQFSR